MDGCPACLLAAAAADDPRGRGAVLLLLPKEMARQLLNNRFNSPPLLGLPGRLVPASRMVGGRDRWDGVAVGASRLASSELHLGGRHAVRCLLGKAGGRGMTAPGNGGFPLAALPAFSEPVTAAGRF